MSAHGIGLDPQGGAIFGNRLRQPLRGARNRIRKIDVGIHKIGVDAQGCAVFAIASVWPGRWTKAFARL